MSACQCLGLIDALEAQVKDCERPGHPAEWTTGWIDNMQARIELLRVEHTVLHAEAVPS